MDTPPGAFADKSDEAVWATRQWRKQDWRFNVRNEDFLGGDGLKQEWSRAVKGGSMGVAQKNYDAATHGENWSRAVAIRMVVSCHNQLRTFFEKQAEMFMGKPTAVPYGIGAVQSYKAVKVLGRHCTQGDFLLEPFPAEVLRCCRDSADRPFLQVVEYRRETAGVFSNVFRRTARLRELRDLRRVTQAHWWLRETKDLVRAVR
ncbi:hypothetical protein AK812_SmicGene431 [Symbiodinium microadriaticum]|uniref:Uncharacterized protein n=1 Tax=Symbiodinium microadriaticum TaxID=2951 RepID=A0A1Q9F6N7_SYMMI|nr:hypothetical protein AK812_SmicGene431 [Symbiodinium microadriaticum]